MNIIELENVSKSYGNKLILNQINLIVQPGELIILQGDIGSGKTTLINLILGLKNPDGGTIEVFGNSPNDPKSRFQLGCMLQEARVPDHLKVRELINLIRSYYPHPLSSERIEEILKITKLKDKEYRLLSDGLSFGEKQHLYFLLSIIGNPDLLILDEPTRGLPKEPHQEFLQQVKNFVLEGKTVIFISQDETDQEKLKDLVTRILTLSQGQLQEEKTSRSVEIINTETKVINVQKSSEQLKNQVSQLSSSLKGQLWVELLDLIRNPWLIGLILVISIALPLGFYHNLDQPNIGWPILIFVAATSPFLIAIQQVAQGIASDRNQGWTKLLRVTPLSPWIYLVSKVITALIVYSLELGLMFGLGIYQGGIQQDFTVWLALFSSLMLGMLVMTLLGCAFGYLFDTKNITIPLLLILGSAVFTSLPLPNMPILLKNLMPFSPFYHYSQLVTWAGKINLNDFMAGITTNQHLDVNLEWLLWTTCVLSFLAIWAYKRDKSFN
jgi:ABC-2 type transport system ATP-binding protein